MKPIICKCGHDWWRHDEANSDLEQKKGCRKCDCKKGDDELIFERIESLENRVRAYRKAWADKRLHWKIADNCAKQFVKSNMNLIDKNSKLEAKLNPKCTCQKCSGLPEELSDANLYKE